VKTDWQRQQYHHARSLDLYIDYEVTVAWEAFEQAIAPGKHAFSNIAAVFDPAYKDDTSTVHHHKWQVKNLSNSLAAPQNAATKNIEGLKTMPMFQCLITSPASLLSGNSLEVGLLPVQPFVELHVSFLLKLTIDSYCSPYLHQKISLKVKEVEFAKAEEIEGNAPI
jgi:hypothetical protein